MNKDKIEYLKNIFLQNNYELNELDIKDLEIQLNRKPIQIYLMGIDWLKKNKTTVTYEKVKTLIKTDIKIRNNVRNIITSLEEFVRVLHLDIIEDSYDIQKFKKQSKKPLSKIIEDIEKSGNSICDIKILNNIKEIRNDVSHLVYFLIFDKLDETIKMLLSIKALEHIDKKVFLKYLDKINELHNECKGWL